MTVQSKWSEKFCPWPHLNGGHTRDECEQTKKATPLNPRSGRQCKYRRIDLDKTRKKNKSPKGTSKQMFAPIRKLHLNCSHDVYYRVFTLADVLWCGKCGDWGKIETVYARGTK